MTDAQVARIIEALDKTRRTIPDMRVWAIMLACIATCTHAANIEQAIRQQAPAKQEGTR